MAEDEKPKKRQRMSIVCVNCKARKIKCDRGRPSCGNCVKVNVGHLCHYEEPHWANRVPAPSSPSSSVTASAPVSTKVDTHESHPTNTTSINDELQRLKEQVATLENQIGNATGSSPLTYSSSSPSLFSRKQSDGSTHAPDDSYNETVDFYDYNTLTFKRSCMEEEKPLSSSSHAKRDPYLLLMQGYSNLCNTLFKSKFGDLKRKPKNKKSRLDASLTEFLLLLGESKTPEINTVVENFIQARSEKHIFPNVGNSNDLDLLKTQIESLLPNKSVLKLYFERFKEVLYPFFPFVDLKFFEDRIFNEIVNGGNQQDSKITLIIEDKFDIIHLATFLIILRLTYISLPDSDQGELLGTPISPEFITKALYCISRFNTMRKTKLPLIQVLLYLKIYFNYSPEDGDGSKLGQSYILFGDIVSSSFVAGINRDPSNSSQLSYDGDFSNLIRRVWHGILEIDRIYSPISGNLCLIQEDSYKVLLPQLVAGEDPEIEIEIANEYKKSRRLLKLFCDLSKLINNVAKPPNVLEILKITAAMKSYLNINYNLRSMKPLKGEPKDKQKTHNFQNSKTLLYNLQANSLILSVYQNLSLIYETNDHFDVNKWKNFQFKALELAMELYNIIYKLLKHGYQDFVDRDHYFYLNRYIENTVQRVLNTLFSMLIRLYHSEDLIARGVAPPEKSSVIEELTSLTFKIAAGLNTLMQSTLGSKYYQAFKSSFRYKFLLRSLNKDGYKCIRNTASFINERFPSDPGKKYLMLRKLELRSNPKNVLNELDNSNIFITLSNPELSDLLNILKSCEILNDPFYSMDDLIWTTSFKYQENDFIHQLENLASHNSTTAIQKPFNIRQPSTNQTTAITALAEASQSLPPAPSVLPPLPPAPSVLPQMSQASPISHILNYQQVIPSDPVLGINGAQLQSNMINLDQFLNDNFFDFDSLWNSEYGLQID